MATHDEHDWHSDEYVGQWVAKMQANETRRQDNFNLMVQLTTKSKDSIIDVLDIGAGYGALTRVLLDAFPKARVVAQDYSELMLAHAKNYLASYGDRVIFVCSDLFSENWATGILQQIPEGFDIIVSAIAIHNLNESSRIREVYKQIFGILKESGCFLNLENVSAPTKEIQRKYQEIMAIRSTRKVSEHPEDESWPPFPGSLEDQLKWLREANFKNIDCFWKELRQVLIGGWK
jgi:tRNA (cmo5U34)-methyltransferase